LWCGFEWRAIRAQILSFFRAAQAIESVEKSTISRKDAKALKPQRIIALLTLRLCVFA
jgi:hypothetical protein